jgi:hypothetical protein
MTDPQSPPPASEGGAHDPGTPIDAPTGVGAPTGASTGASSVAETGIARADRSGLLSMLALAGVVLLAAALAYLWTNPPPPSPEFAARPADVATLNQKVETLTQQVAALENKPAPPPVDLRPLEGRITALEHRPQPAPPSVPDLKPIEDRLAALEQKLGSETASRADLTALEQKVGDTASRADLAAVEQKIPSDVATHAELAAVEQKIPSDVATHAELGAVEQKIPRDVATRADLAGFLARTDALATRQDQLAARQQGLETGFANRIDKLEAGFGNRVDKLDGQLGTVQQSVQQVDTQLQKLPGQVQTLDQRLGTTEKAAGQVASLADRAARIGRIQAAQTALEAGQPLGQIPGAPPALSRFATTPAPTEAELRLTFPAAARAAEQASQPTPTEGHPFLDRLWTRAQDLVTVREGDRVIVGDPAAGVIARARQALSAGDLHGAVAALDGLSGPAAEAMADWKAKATALLDARTALATLAAQA